jgi:hypothetical protein
MFENDTLLYRDSWKDPQLFLKEAFSMADSTIPSSMPLPMTPDPEVTELPEALQPQRNRWVLASQVH